jgi:hypothetical protein
MNKNCDIYSYLEEVKQAKADKSKEKSKTDFGGCDLGLFAVCIIPAFSWCLSFFFVLIRCCLLILVYLTRRSECNVLRGSDANTIHSTTR